MNQTTHTTLRIPKKLKAALVNEAKELGYTEGELVRFILTTHLIFRGKLPPHGEV